MTRVMMMAGGTGGHVFPALAVAEALTSKAADVAWMGTARGIESKLVPNAGYPLFELKVRGLRGNGLLGWLLAPFKVTKAVWEAMCIMRSWKPDVVVGMGGFASGPGGVAAKLLGVPLMIHEQNAIPGLTNRLLANLANVVFEGFQNSFKASLKAQWVGNPVRESIENIEAPKQRYTVTTNKLNLLVLGGSLGAKTLNDVVPAALARINATIRPSVTHQCGSKHIEQCQQNYLDQGVEAHVTAFIDDMAKAYAKADLVICRSGALTVAEVAAAGVPSLLVPYPYAVDDHQTKNGQILVDVGAAEMIQDNQLTIELLEQKLLWAMENRDLLIEYAELARTVSKLGTANVIANQCLEVSRG